MAKRIEILHTEKKDEITPLERKLNAAIIKSILKSIIFKAVSLEKECSYDFGLEKKPPRKKASINRKSSTLLPTPLVWVHPDFTSNEEDKENVEPKNDVVFKTPVVPTKKLPYVLLDPLCRTKSRTYIATKLGGGDSPV